MTYGLKVPEIASLPTEERVGDFHPTDIVATAADVNGDGLDDLIMAGGVHFDPDPDSPTQPAIILLNDGKGGLKRAGGDVSFGFGSSEIIVDDFNGDGNDDVYIPDFGHDFEPFSGYPNRLLLGNGRDGFRDASDRLPSVSDATHSAAAGDIDGDGDVDLYVGNYDRRDPYLLINDGNANFTLNRKDLPKSVAIGVNDYEHVRRALSSEFADMNGDGHIDLILGHEDDGRPNDVNTIFLNDGTGRFSDKAEILLPDNAASRGAFRLTVDVKAMDVNEDGLQDVILLQAPLEYGGWAVQVLIQTPDGAFVDESTARIEGPAFSRKEGYSRFLRIEDVNGDGRDDIMLSDVNDVSRPAFLVNTGFGSFLSVPGSSFGAYNTMFEFGVNVALLDGENVTFADPFVWLDEPLLVTAATDGLPEFEGVGGSEADTMTGDRGNDLMFGMRGGDRLTGMGGNDMIDGGKGNDFVRGNAGADMLRGGGGKDKIKGGDGADVMDGGRGRDKLLGGRGDDVIDGGGGRDKIKGGGGADVIDGGHWRDMLRGGVGADEIDGGVGADVIDGGRGRDTLLGGRGADLFVFFKGSGKDVIGDFQQGKDRIQIVTGADSFEDLSIRQRGDDVQISFAKVAVTVRDALTTDFGSEDFLFDGL